MGFASNQSKRAGVVPFQAFFEARERAEKAEASRDRLIERLNKNIPLLSEAAGKIDALEAELEFHRLAAKTEDEGFAAVAEECERLRVAMDWIESKARARKLEIAPSLLGTGFEFGFCPKGDAVVVNAKTLVDAVEAAMKGAS